MHQVPLIRDERDMSAIPSTALQLVLFLFVSWPWSITYSSILGWMNIHVPHILMFTVFTHRQLFFTVENVDMLEEPASSWFPTPPL